MHGVLCVAVPASPGVSVSDRQQSPIRCPKKLKRLATGPTVFSGATKILAHCRLTVLFLRPCSRYLAREGLRWESHPGSEVHMTLLCCAVPISLHQPMLKTILGLNKGQMVGLGQYILLHRTASSHWSNGWTGTAVYASFRSILASKQPWPSDCMRRTASSMEVYDREQSSLLMASLMLWPFSEDRSTIKHHLLAWCFLDITPNGLIWTIGGIWPFRLGSMCRWFSSTSLFRYSYTTWEWSYADFRFREEGLNVAPFLTPIRKPHLMPLSMNSKRHSSG